MNKKSDILKFINYAYAIGAILVVLGHSTPTGVSDLPLWVDDIRTFIYSFHMPLFFFIAGFLFKYTADKNLKPYCTFIKNKTIKFLSPYLILTIVGILPKVLLSSYVNDDVSFSAEYFIKTIFSPRDNVWGHFWFLPTLLLIYSLSYIILKVSKNKILFLLLLLFSLMLAVFPIDIDWLAINDICDQLVYFCAGIALENIILEKRNQILNIKLDVFLMFMSIILFLFLKDYSYFGYEWLKNLSMVLIAFFMMYSVFFISTSLEKNKKCFLDYFQGKTFSIYIISWPCQAITEIIFNRILCLHWYIVMPLMFVIGLGVPLLINEIYRRLKYHPKFINLVFGFSV